jgi:molybdopterin molybdotransferase
LAQDIHAQYDAPQFTNSAMDGYALHLHADAAVLGYEIVARIAAGDDVAIELKQGQAARIFTGAPIPVGCNAVIAQEFATALDGRLHCTVRPKLNEHIRVQGEDFAVSKMLLHKGAHLTPHAIGLLASQGYGFLPVHQRLRVTVFSTGNELLEPTEPMRAGTIYDANRYQLLAWLNGLNCEVIDGGILPDDLAQTAEQLRRAAEHSELIITSGGASVGEADHLKSAVSAVGELTQWKLSIKPGKPFAWGHIGKAQVMMLPGNPVATFVTFKMLVEPVIRMSMGAAVVDARAAVLYARANFATFKIESRREFLRGVLWFDAQGVAHVDRLTNQGSHMLSACVEANCLIEIEPDAVIQQNALVAVHRF